MLLQLFHREWASHSIGGDKLRALHRTHAAQVGDKWMLPLPAIRPPLRLIAQRSGTPNRWPSANSSSTASAPAQHAGEISFKGFSKARLPNIAWFSIQPALPVSNGIRKLQHLVHELRSKFLGRHNIGHDLPEVFKFFHVLVFDQVMSRYFVALQRQAPVARSQFRRRAWRSTNYLAGLGAEPGRFDDEVLKTIMRFLLSARALT
jgi:hypothetical protein